MKLKPNQLLYVEGDTKPALAGTVLDDDGITPVDLSGYEIALHIGYSPPVVVPAVIDAPNGRYVIQWREGDLREGTWPFELQIIDPSGAIITINRHTTNHQLLELVIDQQVA